MKMDVFTILFLCPFILDYSDNDWHNVSKGDIYNHFFSLTFRFIPSPVGNSKSVIWYFFLFVLYFTHIRFSSLDRGICLNLKVPGDSTRFIHFIKIITIINCQLFIFPQELFFYLNLSSFLYNNLPRHSKATRRGKFFFLKMAN